MEEFFKKNFYFLFAKFGISAINLKLLPGALGW